MRKILLVEDDEMSAELMIDQLKLIDMCFYDDTSFTIAKNKQQFKEYVDRQDFDIILSDFNLDIDFNGLDVIHYLQSINIDKPIIIVSGAIGEENAADLMKNGASDFILKDNIDKLHLVILKELEQSTYKINQSKVIQTINDVLMKFTKTINWILQHNIDEISFDKIISSFGMILEVDRAYIFSKENCQYELKYLWCNVDNCENEHCNRQNYECLSFEKLNSVISYIEQNEAIHGVYSNFDDEIQQEFIQNKIKSFILIPIIKPNNEVWGFLGFDDCNKERLWTQLEINTLKTLSAILGTLIFKLILKKKEDNEIAEQVKMLATARQSILSYLSTQDEQNV